MRVLFSRIRVAFDLLTLATLVFARTKPKHCASMRFTPIHAAILLALVTLGGAVTATVCQLVHRVPPLCGHGQHEWIFAVESAGVLLLLALWTACARPWRSRRDEAEAERTYCVSGREGLAAAAAAH